MKKINLNLMLFFTAIIFAQSQGDIAFVGYNGDGDDDFAILALANIPENTTIYFTDSEPNVSGNGMNDQGEGVITWLTGSSIINAGTIITFTDVDNDTNTNFGVSVGSITRSKSGFSLVVGTDGDELFATLGNPATNEVMVWLAGIEVHDNGRPDNFIQSGLTPGINYLIIDDTQSKDGGQYTGVKTGKTVEEYRVLINNENQWTTNTSDGELFVPFDTTSFTFITLTSKKDIIEELVVTEQNQELTSNIGKIISVHNVLGQKILNQNLSEGIYMLTIRNKDELIHYKFALEYKF